MKLGYTQLMIYRECPRKFYFGQILQYQTVEVAAPMECGLFVHSAISAALKKMDWQTEIGLNLNKTLQKLNLIEDKARRDKAESATIDNATRARLLCDRYIAHYLKDYEVISIDDNLTLGNVVCHPDLICNYKGKVAVVDFKTSKSPEIRWYAHSGQGDLYASITRLTTMWQPEIVIYDVISEIGLFRLEHLFNERKAQDLQRYIEELAHYCNISSPKEYWTQDFPAHWHYDCLSRCEYYNPCVLLEENNPDGCTEFLEKNYEKRYFKNE